MDAVRIRAIQGHRAFLVEQGGMSSMIKTMFTFDENFDQAKIDDPTVHPGILRDAGRLACVAQVPQGVVYHTCDQAAFNSIIKHGPESLADSRTKRAEPTTFQLHSALESGNEKVARYGAGGQSPSRSTWSS